jgi:translation initiation factor 2B subunit (eIF-2B alpha/beta/delta family)
MIIASVNFKESALLSQISMQVFRVESRPRHLGNFGVNQLKNGEAETRQVISAPLRVALMSLD